MFLFLALFFGIEPRLFEFVVGDRGFHPVRNELHALLHFGNFVRQHGLAQLHARARLVQEIDGLVRQKTVWDVAVREIHGVSNGFLRVTHRVELLVAVPHALQHADRFVLIRRRNLHGLEPPLKRTILLDRFAIFSRSCRADALDFTPAQRGLQYIGGIQRSFRRSRAHQRVQFVDEHDRVLTLHQFFHDGLQPFFELPAIFRARHDQGQIEREDSLVRQERRHVAVGNPLCEPFDDRRLAHARLADQHRIVFRPPAQNLDRAFQLAIPSHERIELAFHRRLGQIAAEFSKQRRFFRPVHRHLLSRATSHFLAHGGKPQSPFQQDFGTKGFFFPQHPKQQVFRSDVFVTEPFSFFRGVVEDALAFLAEGNFHRSGNALAHGDARLDFLSDGLDRAVGPEKSVGQRLIFAQQAEQQVLRLDVRASVLARLVPCEKDHSTCFLCVSLKQGLPTLSRGPYPNACRSRRMTRGICKHFCARSQFPVLQGKNTVRALCQIQIVRSQNRRQVVGPVQALDEFENGFCAPFVQIPGRFVGEKNLGPVHERPCDGHALLFAA